ncbi:hypothetical protein HBA55_08615 [Pseudomaricurvus alkylphenolicus]|uniref:hypothetical protein n=1 Tax=Pseudomaricurvus alkylphenolicus TaxID=1306991 RepID=UPI001421BB93|nr:hypothetical protein [Pseudomaricurvus alkylphenolicus]NIB39645.1 hypothetical protein [Pseudomaricurvus alkylphenolicus]
MLTVTIIFLAFTLWTLFHWQTLPELLTNESEGEPWPLSIHHTATPIRLVVMTLIYAGWSYFLLYVMTSLLENIMTPERASWLALALLIGAHFFPYLSGLCSFVRYFFQRHLFFPSLPSHQEDQIIGVLMGQAVKGGNLRKEIKHLQKLLKQEFRSPIHAFNLVGLRNEHKLVRQEYKSLRRKGVLKQRELDEWERQLLNFHLYSCYRLLTRITLARYWAGRDRRRAFRELGYLIKIGDGDIYAKARRLKYALWNILLHGHLRRPHAHQGSKSAQTQ